MTAATRHRRLPGLLIVIAGAWLITLAAQSTGNAALLHHQALVEGGPPPWIAVPIFLVGWQVMIVAMMLPASLPSLGLFSARAAHGPRPGKALATFLASYGFIWTAFGLVALTGDAVLHRFVVATPWLAARPWLIEAAVLALAGVWQLTPLKRRCLAACRHPAGLLPTSLPRRGAISVGFEHGLACLGSAWALMLLMFAEGFGNLWWMVALTALMVYETTGRDGQRAALAAGAILLVFAAVLA